MRFAPQISLAAVALSALLAAPLAAQTAGPAPFYLHDGDTVLFYGDSITEQRFYTQFIEIYAETRFPHRQITFYNAGIGGDRVTGGSGGPIDLRLSRDVFPQKPTVVTIMLGMNDGSYTPLTPQIEKTYTDGYRHILESLQKTIPNVRITLFGPSPYDEVTRPEIFPGGYNSTLVHFSNIDRELAQKYKCAYIDFNAPFIAALKRGEALMPAATPLLLPDRVHPEQLYHWFMADAALKGWNAPAIVSSVTLNAAGKLLDHQNTQISELTAAGDTLSWTQLDDALPLPIDKEKHAGFQFINQMQDIFADLDQQPLKVQGLKHGTWQLTIDGAPIQKFSAAELAAGINLAEYGTPMRGQAYRVGWLARDRDETHYIRLRMLVTERDRNVPAEPGITDLAKFEQAQQTQIYETAQPKPHHFQLTPTPTP